MLARLVLRCGDADAADDLVGDLLADLVARRRQCGSITELLNLEPAALKAALRRRLLQVRAAHLGSKSRLVKTLRAHVAAALEVELPAAELLPLTLVVGDRLSGRLVRQAVAFLLTQAGALPREPRALAAELLALYFTARHDDVRAAAHGEGDAGHEDLVLRTVDAERHVDQLQGRLGHELVRIVGRRAHGLPLTKVGAGAASTAHDQLRRAAARVRQHVELHGLVAEDLEPVLHALAA